MDPDTRIKDATPNTWKMPSSPRVPTYRWRASGACAHVPQDFHASSAFETRKISWQQQTHPSKELQPRSIVAASAVHGQEGMEPPMRAVVVFRENKFKQQLTNSAKGRNHKLIKAVQISNQ